MVTNSSINFYSLKFPFFEVKNIILSSVAWVQITWIITKTVTLHFPHTSNGRNFSNSLISNGSSTLFSIPSSSTPSDLKLSLESYYCRLVSGVLLLLEFSGFLLSTVQVYCFFFRSYKVFQVATFKDLKDSSLRLQLRWKRSAYNLQKSSKDLLKFALLAKIYLVCSSWWSRSISLLCRGLLQSRLECTRKEKYAEAG